MADGPRLTFLGRIIVLLFVVLCGYGAFLLFKNRQTTTSPGPAPTANGTAVAGVAGNKVTIGVAYGTEKERWLEWAVTEFAKTDAGKQIAINLIPMGSLEGAQAIVAGDKRINAWTPASSLYLDVFTQDWQLKYNSKPIIRQEQLALTPMVFVFWQERYQAFTGKYPEVSFTAIDHALHEPGGWQTIAGKGEWGLFKFGHTHPNESNSGLAALYLMLCEYSNKSRGLTLADVVNPGFNSWLTSIESGVTGLSNSTGNMMRDMVLRGPSSYDCLFVYESVVLDYLKNAEGRWGELRVIYPKLNIWNDNPYYVLDAPWSTEDQRKAAGTFLDFLMSEQIQRASLDHGFRPGNPNVPVRFGDSPFVKYESSGLKVDLGTVCDPPKAEVITNLLALWERTRGSRQ